MPIANPSSNLISAATMTNMVPSTAVRRDSVSRTGGGLVALSGSYTGQTDTVIDIEVTSEIISGDPQISAPVLVGAGNGTISDVSADPGSTAQSITVTLVDLGIMTRAAFANFQAGTFRAKASGPGGNDITVTIDRSGLTYTPTDYATPAAMSAGEQVLEGEQWNWGGKNINPDGTVPVTTARIALGRDPTVLRQFRKFVNGRNRYIHSPQLANNFPAGTRISNVTGTYEVTVTDGVTPEVYSGVQTLYDLLLQIQTSSDLIYYDGAIANDTRPGGMALDDLGVFTASYVYDQLQSGSPHVVDAAVVIEPDSDAPTEALTIMCERNDIPGAEVWRVQGEVSQRLRDAVTGVLYSDGHYAFTVPAATPPSIAPTGTKSVAIQTQNANVSVCVTQFVLGLHAKTQTLTFRWREPEEQCECDTSGVVGGPNPDWLGVDPEFDPAEAGMSRLIPANILTRYTAVDTWLDTYLSSQITVNSGDTGSGINVPIATAKGDTYFRGIAENASAVVKIDSNEVKAAKRVCTLLRKALVDINAEFPGTFPEDGGTMFDSMFTSVQSVMAEFASNTGGGVWLRDIDFVIQNTGAGIAQSLSEYDDAEDLTLKQLISSNTERFFIRSPDEFLQIFEPKINKIYVAAGVLPPFDNASVTGGGVWQDYGGGRWESEEGYLAIFNDIYWHSARMEDDGTGQQVPTPTMEFGLGISIGCPQDLTPGDKLVIKIEQVNSPGVTYQPGDTIRAAIVRADPVQFGGGQTGNDTLTWTVEGTADTFANYELVLTAPAAYSDNGLDFLIEQGPIPFELGDLYQFAMEGGAFRYRQDGGSWVEDVDIAPTVALVSGLSATFQPGAAPSFVDGDAYTYTALATNGPVRLETPDGGACRWIGSTEIVSAGGAFDSLLIWHQMASSCSITLQGSDDNFSTTPLSIVLPWRRDVVAYQWADALTYAKLRLVITGGDGLIRWWWVEQRYSPTLSDGREWFGDLEISRDFRNGGGTGRLGFSSISAASIDALQDLLVDAEADHDGRFGVLFGGTDAIVARLSDGTRPQISDDWGYQADNRAHRSHTIAMDLELIA